MQYKAVFFDLDDTLIVELAAAEEAFIKTGLIAQEKYGIKSGDLHQAVRKKAREIWYQMETYPYAMKIGISSWEALWANFADEDENIKKLGLLSPLYRFHSWKNALQEFNIQDGELAELLAETFPAERRKLHKTFPETIQVMEALSKKYPLGIISNGVPDLQYEKIRGSGIGPFFKHIIISGELGVGKPEGAIFIEAMKRFNVNKEECIMTGDSLKTDIAGAKNAGIASVWINRDNKAEDETIRPDRTISSLLEILDIL